MLYTIIYDFMWRDLGLKGAEKEVFPVIYGFWRKEKTSVEISLQAISSITGLSRSSIISAKRNLVRRKLISTVEIRGKPSRYEVLAKDPYEDRTGSESAPVHVQKQNGWWSKNNTGTETALKINNISRINYEKRNRTRSLDVGNPQDFDLPDNI